MRSVPRPRTAAIFALSALAALLALSGACRRAEERRVAASAARYTVRGEVVKVEAAPSGRTLLVRHEAIPDFVDSSGKRVGMAPMVMAFSVGPGVGAEALTPGDRIRFRFAVDWEASAMQVESIERLPAGTDLVLEKNAP